MGGRNNDSGLQTRENNKENTLERVKRIELLIETMQNFTVIDDSGIFASITEIPDRKHTYNRYEKIPFLDKRR